MAEEKMAEMLQTLTGVLKGLSVQQTPQLPKVKLQKFKGPPRSPGDPSLKEWLDEFEAYSNCYKLSGKSKAQALVDHLGGIAKEEILCRADSVREDYDELVQILKSQFCPVESLQTLSASFHSCVQKDGESLADFSRNLMRYYSRMEQAAPSEDEKKALHALRDTSLKEGFVRGAREASVRRELRRIELAMKSKPFMDMRSEALDLFRDQESIRKIGVKEVKMEDPLIGVVSCDKESVVDINELSELRGHLNQLCRQVAVLADSVKSMKTTPKVPQNEVVCYNCGKKGHIRPRCTEPTLCYNCKGRGHVSKNCPEAVISNSPISSNVPVDSPSVRVSGIGNAKSSVLTQKLISHSPRGKVRFKDVKLGCVFDTGAEASIIPSSVFHSQLQNLDCGLQQHDGLFVNVVGVGGVEVPVEGYVEVPITIEGQDLVGSFLVIHDEVGRSAQCEHPILLGCNILRQLPFKMMESVLSQSFKPKEGCGDELAGCSTHISVSSEEVLPPLSVRRVVCKVQSSAFDTDEVLVKDTLSRFDPTLCTVEGSQSIRGDSVELLVQNSSEHEVRIPPHTPVAEAQAVSRKQEVHVEFQEEGSLLVSGHDVITDQTPSIKEDTNKAGSRDGVDLPKGVKLEGLSVVEEEKIVELLAQHKDAFSEGSFDLGECIVVPHENCRRSSYKATISTFAPCTNR
ncbi:uncharacterized protein LOC121421569 [Lytechinus variegatus]|uniref:uncharacterized protein LOC121421569 n=1 Tax=Lytechinus variegatus TaxID=7654 RepID=UPI001BB29AFE|nr:uncharacterized protein LOC121421569 [Lytechinus variegatus]